MLRLITSNQFIIIGSYANVRTTTFFNEAKKYLKEKEPVIAQGYSIDEVDGTGHYHETVWMIDDENKLFKTVAGDLYTPKAIVTLFEKTTDFEDSNEYNALVGDRMESEDIKYVGKNGYFMNFSRGLKTKSVKTASKWLQKGDFIKLSVGITGKTKKGDPITCSMWTSKIKDIHPEEGLVITEAKRLYLVG